MTSSTYLNKSNGELVLLIDVPLHIISMFDRLLKRKGLEVRTYSKAASVKFKEVK